MKNLNMQKGLIFPAFAIEGNISIVDSVSVKGDDKVPVLSNPVKQGDEVVLTGMNDEIAVIKATGDNGVVIGYVHDHPEYDTDPAISYTEEEAIQNSILRKVGVESAFTQIRTLPVKTGETINAGDSVEFSDSGYVKADNETGLIALTKVLTNNNIVVGIK